ncbi:hypothetical protein Leryth_006923 [Lithospermum erythrorhizon]|nr:hypothetical protein Leryth_006923 [Lithospermum erythrorhizon]
MARSSFNVELDAAQATWLTGDVAILSTKTGELLLLTLVYDGRTVQRLDLSKSRASVLTSGIATMGNSFFFLGSRLGDSLLVQFASKVGGSTIPSAIKEEIGDIEGDIPSAKRIRMSSSDIMQDIANGEELSFYSSDPNIAESSQKTFSFSVRDSLINVGPLRDFSYGLRVNADPNAVGVAKQSNYELVCCSGHGKNGALSVLQRSIRPETITQESLPGCKGIWAVYHKSARSHIIESSKGSDDDEYHAYLVISLESRTMVLQTANNLEEVTENVDYYIQGPTIAAGNLFGRRRVIQVFACGARVLDGAFMTQELSFKVTNAEAGSGAEDAIVLSVSIADPYVLLRMSDGSIQLLVGDPSSCTVSVTSPAAFEGSQNLISACTLYHDKGPVPWLRTASSDAWLSTGVGEAIDGADGASQDQGDVYCLICYESGDLEILDVPKLNRVFEVDKFVSGRAHLIDSLLQEPPVDCQRHSKKGSMDMSGHGRKDGSDSIKVVELAMHRWSGQHSRPILFGILSDGTILCYHAYIYEGSENAPKLEEFSSSISASRLHNLRFVRIPLDSYVREEMSPGSSNKRITMFKNIGGCQGSFFCGSRPVWFMLFRERIRMHPQTCDGPIAAFTVLHNVNCNHGFIYVTAQGSLKICQLPSQLSYDNHWPVQKIPLKGTPHQVTYFADKNLYSLIVSVQVAKPINQVLSSLVDQEVGLVEHDMTNVDGTYNVEEFEVRIMEPEKSGGPWQTRATIPMQISENALTVRVVTLFNTAKRENETLLAIGTAYVQGEDVAARGRIILCSIDKSPDGPQTSVLEVYSKELKGAISAVTSIQGHLLIASGPKIILHRWTGSDLDGVAFYDVPPLHVVSLNIVKNFILLGDIHKSIYFLSWKEQDRQLTLLAKDFGSLDCLATEFLIDGSTLSLIVSDDQKNVQIFYYAPKMSESWKGQKLLSRAEFHVGSHITKFMRLQLLPTISDRTGGAPVSDKTNRFGLLFGTLDGSIGCVAPLDELTFRRLHSLQRKLVDTVAHVAGLNPKSFRQFQSKGKAHRPGPDGIVDFELLCRYEMLSLEEQMEIAQQVGTTRMQVISNLNDLALSTSFL